MTTADRLNKIEARANAATKGPWEVLGRNDVVRDAGHCTCGMPTGVYGHEWACGAEQVAQAAEVDSEFIAHARTDVPWLIEQVRKRDAALRAVLELADRWATQSTDYDEDTEQQIDDGKAIVRAIEEALS